MCALAVLAGCGATPGYSRIVPDAGEVDLPTTGTGGMIADTGGTTGTGGTPAGGSAGPMGATDKGGTTGAAGATNGGADGKGGVGGTTALGGTPGTGGLGGRAGGGMQGATGGMPGTGGLQPTGGMMGTGGTTGVGGQPGRGGGGGGKGGAGATGGGGGTPPVVFDCAASRTPAGGLISDFASWDATTMRWKASTGAFGTVFTYHDASSTSTAEVGSNLHFTGTIAGFAGLGILFDRCEAVGAGNTAIQFTVSGTAPNCALELQLQTYSLRPTTQVPAGGCTMSSTSDCYNMFPKASNLTTSGTAKVTLANMSMWTTARASEIIGVQFQLSGTCTADLRFDDIKLVP